MDSKDLFHVIYSERLVGTLRHIIYLLKKKIEKILISLPTNLLNVVLEDPHVGCWRLLQVPSTVRKPVIAVCGEQFIPTLERLSIQLEYVYPKIEII